MQLQVLAVTPSLLWGGLYLFCLFTYAFKHVLLPAFGCWDPNTTSWVVCSPHTAIKVSFLAFFNQGRKKEEKRMKEILN